MKNCLAFARKHSGDTEAKLGNQDRMYHRKFSLWWDFFVLCRMTII